jgi:hypothetical protein
MGELGPLRREKCLGKRLRLGWIHASSRAPSIGTASFPAGRYSSSAAGEPVAQ